MSVDALQPATTNPTLSDRTIKLLSGVAILASLNETTLHCLDGTTERTLAAGEVLVHQGELTRFFWILLSGTMTISTSTAENAEASFYKMDAGNAFGEIPLLANIPAGVTYRAADECELLELDEEQFWKLMTSCPQVRKAILGNMAVRLAKMQATSFQQEKMASLGTLAAGLMHELNNPGSAAKRASAQLRGNLERMHRLTESWAKRDLTLAQKQCMFDLQQQALHSTKTLALSTIEQSDAEEHFADWLENAHVQDAWQLAPTFVSVGMHSDDLECARTNFDDGLLSESLNWLEAMVSSMQLVGTIEDSISRVTDLVHSVKSYAYEGHGKQAIDINSSIHATLVILGHKIREKQLMLNKDFGAGLPTLQTECQGLNQIWTNLLDNAIDAAPRGGVLGIHTWAEQVRPGSDGKGISDLCIMISDNGAGIPIEIQPHIFDPFYTTKPVGVGTGLGLGIVYRIVEQYGGTIRFTSTPGETEFVVRLPSSRS